jgi:TPP-dependent pyruvate/acetoin dehydrogenase alpha subunit
MSGSIIDSMQSFTMPKQLLAKTSSTAAATKQTEQTAEQKFLDYAKKSPAEKIRDALLQSIGVTEDELKSMTPEQRKEVEQKIADKIKEAMQKQTDKGESTKGFFADISA